jgi:hypothetical protein
MSQALISELYPHAVNSSLVQVIEPFANWEEATILGYGVNAMLAFAQAQVYWRRIAPKSSWLLKRALFLLFASLSVYVPVGFLAISQVLSPTHWPYDVAQSVYCVVLAVSACVRACVC